MAPIEGRGVVAMWDSRLEQLTIYSACQMPHIVRTGLSECLGLDEGPGARDCARRRRRLRLQGHPARRGDLPRLACHALRSSGALDRGPPRASDRRRQLPRAPLSDHRLCRPRRHVARHRLRGRRRFRRLFGLSVLGLPRGRAGREHPAGALRLSLLPLPHLFGRDQQMSDPALSRRGPNRRLLRAGTRARRYRARSRRRAASKCGRRYWSSPSRCRSTTSPRSISTAAIIRNRCAARSRRSTLRRCARASKRRSRRPADRRRACDLLRAGRARHLGLLRLGHSHGAGLRTGDRAADAGRRTGIAGRRAVARPKSRDDAGAGGARDPRDRRRQDQSGARRHRHDAVFDRHVGIALHGHGGRCGVGGVQGDRQARRKGRCATSANRCGAGDCARRRGGRPAGIDHAAARSRGPGI